MEHKAVREHVNGDYSIECDCSGCAGAAQGPNVTEACCDVAWIPHNLIIYYTLAFVIYYFVHKCI